MNKRQVDGYKYKRIDRPLLLAIVGGYAALNAAGTVAEMFANGPNLRYVLGLLIMSYILFLALAVLFMRSPSVSALHRRSIQATAFWTWILSIFFFVFLFADEYFLHIVWLPSAYHVWAGVWMIAMGVTWWLSR